MKSTCILIALSLVVIFSSAAQNKSAGSIRGKITEKSGDPVAYATLMLLNKDSVLVKADYSRDDGSFVFENILAGEYQIKLRSIQYETFISEIISLQEGQNITLEPIHVLEMVQQLAEVKVTATKPLIEVHPDKTVFNVSASPNTAGTDALEMLKKAPGVVVDNNDRIMLQGKSGVKVYIDGKPSRLSGDDLVNMLRAMQSDGVEAVDIITNPSAKYEAEGNAGIIDIKLKRDKNLGLKATLNGGYNISRFYRYQGGVDFNYRDRKLNIFGNYNYHNQKGYSAESYVKQIKDNFLDQSSEVIWFNGGHGYRLGADYLLNKQHLIGFVVNGNIAALDADVNSTTPFGFVGSGIVEQRLDAISRRDMNFINTNSNINYVYTGSKGAKLNLDVDYGNFFKDGESNQSNIYRNEENGNVIEARYSADDQITGIDIKAAKGDYEKTIGSGKLAFGGKFSDVKTDNSFKFFNILDENREVDVNKSNDFVFTERIGAAYISYNDKLDEKITYNVGLRSELTNSTGVLESIQNNNENSVERSYVDVFPSGGVAYQLNKKNKFALNYSRRIDRPNYENLNPFEFQLDELTFRKGNPFLKPQYTNSFKITHSFDNKLNTQISYSNTSNYFAQLLDTLGGRGSMISVQNIASSQNIGLNVNYTMDITKKWNVYTNCNLYKNYFASEIPGKNFNINAAVVNIYAKSNLLLPYDFNFEVSGWYNSPSIWGGTFKMEEMWSVEAGIRKPIWDKRASVKVSVSDIFKTTGWSGSSDYGGIKIQGGGQNDSRRIKFSVTYNLGNQQVKGSRNRSTGLDDEKNRVGGGNGQ